MSWKIEVGCPIQSRDNLEYSTLQPNMAEATVVLHVAWPQCYRCSADMKTKLLDKNNNNEDDDNGKQTTKKAKTN